MSQPTFFFYDLETSGINPGGARIMQFAGQRTDLKLKNIGEPVNLLIKLTDDVIPDPRAVLVHGITPQRTLSEGLSELEFIDTLLNKIATPGTIMAGFNSIRFDDEFIRYTLWRNLRDPYEWHWQDGRSRWDLLDVVRMIRALRPDGINWPEKDGLPINKLEDLATANDIAIAGAHDALVDIQATIELARLLYQKQPQIFDFLLQNRDKNTVLRIIAPTEPMPFVYTSGRYPREHEHTTTAVVLGKSTQDSNGYIVYDLRHDPAELDQLSLKELAARLFVKQEDRDRLSPLPIKKLAINRAPAVAPLGTLDESSQQRLELSIDTIQQHFDALRARPELIERLLTIWEQRSEYPAHTDVDAQLYDGGFISDRDREKRNHLLALDREELATVTGEFKDDRLNQLLWRLQLRHFRDLVDLSEQEKWDDYRAEVFTEGRAGAPNLKTFASTLQELAAQGVTAEQRFLLEELQLYVESIVPPQLLD
jgi:exodeoxyribonuclease-1